MTQFSKYEAAGNTYLIIRDSRILLSQKQAQIVCDRTYGAGADGAICWQRVGKNAATVRATIFNPDGSEAEKSGNGLRILATFLFESEFAATTSLEIKTSASAVKAQKLPDHSILLEMGKVVPQFDLNILSENMSGFGKLSLSTPMGDVEGYPVSIGNPHFVVFLPKISPNHAQRWGPLIENHPIFNNRTNVQFARVASPSLVYAEIWERGAGYTLSSGSSSCAIAAVAHKLGYCQPPITVQMPGGQLEIDIHDDGTVLLKGPVSKVVDGVVYLD